MFLNSLYCCKIGGEIATKNSVDFGGGFGYCV
jgi:hypothetical protein